MGKKKTDTKYPIVTVGNHSIRREYEDGRVEFETDWDKLKAHVKEALDEFAASISKPAVKAKTTRKKKDVKA